MTSAPIAGAVWLNPQPKASVLAAAQAELADDASVLCIDWHGSGTEGG